MDNSLGTINTTGAVNHSVTDMQGLRTDIPGQAATVSELSSAEANPQDLLLREVEQTIVDFEPANFILGTIAARAATRRFSGSMEVDYFVMGADRVTASTTGGYNPDTLTPTAVLPLSASDAGLFQEDLLVKVRGIQGFLPDGKTVDSKHELFLQVVGRTGDGLNPLFYAINGAKVVSADPQTLVPPIPNGTALYIMNTAAGESQLFTSPMSHTPQPRTAYMQRKVLNIQVSRYFREARKRVAWGEEDILEKAIREFRRRTEINYLEGVQSKRMTVNTNRRLAGQELIYTSEGLLSQIGRSFAYTAGSFTFGDLLRLSEELFADNNGGKQALLCVGRGLGSSILNGDYTLSRDLTIGRSTHWGIDMTDYTSLYGTISMVHYPIMDQIGRGWQGIAIDPSRLFRYVYREPYRQNIDMSVHGEEASRDVYVETDCLVLKGDNHLLVKPSPAPLGGDLLPL